MATNGANDGKGRDATGAKRVLETGIVLVHRGELVFPAVGSEAEADLVAEDARAEIHYHFPVEIEIRATGDTFDPAAVAERALERLLRRLREDP
jgi:hypothetical protein